MRNRLTVWKYDLAPVKQTTLVMPFFAEILTVAEQDSKVCLWALVNPEGEQEERTFVVHGTGHEIPAGVYRGSAFVGPFVWHVFETTPVPF